MKMMIFVDFQNFCQSLWKIDRRRQERISGLSDFLLNYLIKSLKWDKYIPRLIRNYVYTGEYADTTIKKIQYHLQRAKRENSNDVSNIEKFLQDSIRRQAGQKNAVDRIKKFSSFLELRTKPLQYAGGKIFQKGIDVQLAVDLVSHAYLDSYDVAIVCSGDVDLIESIKLVKNLGKKVIVFSHPENTAAHIFRECDYYIDMSTLNTEELDKISHIASADIKGEIPQ